MPMAYVMEEAGEGGGGSIDPFLIPDGLEDYEPTGGESGEGGNGDEGGKGGQDGGATGGEGGAAAGAAAAAEDAGEQSTFTVPEGLSPIWGSIAANEGEGFTLPEDIKPENELAYLSNYFNTGFVEGLNPRVRDLVYAAVKNPSLDIDNFVQSTVEPFHIEGMNDRDVIYNSLISKAKLDVSNPEHADRVKETREYVDGLKDVEVLDRIDNAKKYLEGINNDARQKYENDVETRRVAYINAQNDNFQQLRDQAYEAMKVKKDIYGVPFTESEHQQIKATMDRLYRLDENGSNLMTEYWNSMSPTQIYEFLAVNLKGNQGFVNYFKELKDSAGKAIFEKLDLKPSINSAGGSEGGSVDFDNFLRP